MNKSPEFDGPDVAALSLAADGAECFPGAVNAVAVTELRGRLDKVLTGRPGRRLVGEAWRNVVAQGSALARIACGFIGEAAHPVRVVAFDKTPETNWGLAWHQDRAIAVRERIEVEGFGPWSTKDGILHVAPPISLLADMITLRLHLDDCGDDNAPLKVALGSHQLGQVAAGEAADLASRHRELVCCAAAGDVWVYSTLILHASDRAERPGRRRVLQVDYAARDLPGGLEWLGI